MSREEAQSAESYRTTEQPQAHSKRGHRDELVVVPSLQDHLSRDLMFETHPLSESTSSSNATQILA
jgi:hypothetical protein